MAGSWIGDAPLINHTALGPVLVGPHSAQSDTIALAADAPFVVKFMLASCQRGDKINCFQVNGTAGLLHLQPLALSSEAKSYKIILMVGVDRHEI